MLNFVGLQLYCLHDMHLVGCLVNLHRGFIDYNLMRMTVFALLQVGGGGGGGGDSLRRGGVSLPH